MTLQLSEGSRRNPQPARDLRGVPVALLPLSLCSGVPGDLLTATGEQGRHCGEAAAVAPEEEEAGEELSRGSKKPNLKSGPGRCVCAQRPLAV